MIKDFRWFPTQQLPKYPHLQKSESALADAFASANPRNFKKIAYDCALGPFKNNLRSASRSLARDWAYLNSYKADAIGWDGTDYYIVEFKIHPSFTIVAQLLFYQHLFKDNFTPGYYPHLIAVTTPPRDPVKEYIGRHDIDLYFYDIEGLAPRSYDHQPPIKVL